MTLMRRAAVPAPPAGAVSTTSAAAGTTLHGLHSAVYTGWVRHRRYAPKALAFRYPLFLLYLDLDELEQVFARRWLWSVNRRNLAEFRRSDYLGDPAQPLDEAVRDRVQQHTGERPLGPVRMLTHLRYFGHCFNPVTFYYCHDAQQRLHSIVAEITNTPWRQRHAYVLPMAEAHSHGTTHAWRFAKRFHVSPFMAMAHTYAWRFSEPAAQLRVHMDVLDPAPAATRRRFDATLVLQRRVLDGASLAQALLRYPAMTLQVMAKIHWQALRLWLRGNPVHDHPDHSLPRERR
ncbi:DUF1365 domain-containing protein [Xanthomonas sp. A2111]|uniref:DUF1365 domain-containing protein n=1 Tax=Xanthomonas hawaiiensis TaxID=3003247 RepID=A0ABU2I1C3_9XANT|nr:MULTISPECIES: DUF1365 domain-containing protein [unclassified Xanthomonas]MBO9830442.1 DUF1365 domain-containing protein [Xanthomonas sp. A2111]MBO9874675.1 DUF1365 domain-containing protein [Xanthomonas sp. D-93]MDS9991934.1 DUF1365 domain-containing protein [Xanthomonas sp. A2111]WNH43734.1 DUF1365 domain-containing protein [Xanthomonas sp. A6251]